MLGIWGNGCHLTNAMQVMYTVEFQLKRTSGDYLFLPLGLEVRDLRNRKVKSKVM